MAQASGAATVSNEVAKSNDISRVSATGEATGCRLKVGVICAPWWRVVSLSHRQKLFGPVITVKRFPLIHDAAQDVVEKGRITFDNVESVPMYTLDKDKAVNDRGRFD